jgi:uncharacterized membrane protein YbaN (DUF454 family)
VAFLRSHFQLRGEHGAKDGDHCAFQALLGQFNCVLNCVLSAVPLCLTLIMGSIFVWLTSSVEKPFPVFETFGIPISAVTTLIFLAVATAAYIRSLRAILKEAKPTSKVITQYEQRRAVADGMSTGALAFYAILFLLLAAAFGAWAVISTRL